MVLVIIPQGAKRPKRGVGGDVECCSRVALPLLYIARSVAPAGDRTKETMLWSSTKWHSLLLVVTALSCLCRPLHAKEETLETKVQGRAEGVFPRFLSRSGHHQRHTREEDQVERQVHLYLHGSQTTSIPTNHHPSSH